MPRIYRQGDCIGSECLMNNYCPVCGGLMIGDGYTIVYHCENVDLPLDIEPDAGPIFCNEMGKSFNSKNGQANQNQNVDLYKERLNLKAPAA